VNSIYLPVARVLPQCTASLATWWSRPWRHRVKTINTDYVKNITASFLLEIKATIWQLSNSTAQNPTWEGNNHSADKKKSPSYEARRFTTVFTRARQWTLPWARWILSTHPHYTALWSGLTWGHCSISSWRH
jgi:hypothetical protein